MEANSHEPAGFCPYCDYATDPGRCTECGREIAENDLCISPRRRRIKRVVQRTCKTLLIAAVLGGIGYGIYHETRPHRWVRYCTTNYLLSIEREGGFQNGAPFRSSMSINNELIRRIKLKQLSQTQFDELVRLYTGSYFPVVDIRSPYPVGFNAMLAGKPRECARYAPYITGQPGLYQTIPYLLSHIHEGDVLYINGSIVKSNEYGTRLSPYNFLRGGINDPRPAIDFLHTLSLGTHDFKLVRTVRFDETSPGISQTEDSWESYYLPTSITYVTEQSLDIVEAEATSLVNARYEEAHEQLITDRAEFKQYDFANELNQADVYKFPNIAGFCCIYLDSALEEDNNPCCWRIPQNNCVADLIVRQCGEDATGGRAIFVPDAALAFDAGYDDYFNGVIEWHNIKIENGMPVFGTPDVIRPYNPDEFDVESMLSKSED